MPDRASAVAPPSPRPAVDEASSLPARNRRTAVGLVVWIVSLMLLSALVAWLRN